MGVDIRLRDDGDRDALVRLLCKQQPVSGYPVRWPLPGPVEGFIFRDRDEIAWVACHGDEIVGHVAVGRTSAELDDVFVPVLGVPGESLRVVTTLFTAPRVQGRGVCGRLLRTAEQYIEAGAPTGVLDVVPTHERAFAMYLRRGWQVVAQRRPAWQPADAPDFRYLVLRRQLPPPCVQVHPGAFARKAEGTSAS